MVFSAQFHFDRYCLTSPLLAQKPNFCRILYSHSLCLVAVCRLALKLWLTDWLIDWKILGSVKNFVWCKRTYNMLFYIKFHLGRSEYLWALKQSTFANHGHIWRTTGNLPFFYASISGYRYILFPAWITTANLIKFSMFWAPIPSAFHRSARTNWTSDILEPWFTIHVKFHLGRYIVFPEGRKSTNLVVFSKSPVHWPPPDLRCIYVTDHVMASVRFPVRCLATSYTHPPVNTSVITDPKPVSLAPINRAVITACCLLSLYTSAYVEQHPRALLMNSACRRISARDVAFVQHHLHHWSSAVRVCQPSATELFLSPPHTRGTVCRST